MCGFVLGRVSVCAVLLDRLALKPGVCMYVCEGGRECRPCRLFFYQSAAATVKTVRTMCAEQAHMQPGGVVPPVGFCCF